MEQDRGQQGVTTRTEGEPSSCMSQLSKWKASAGIGTKDFAGGMAGAANFSTGAGRSCGREQSVEVCITGRMSAPHGENE